MATAKKAAVTKPNIQIDDVVREMTDEEYAIYLQESELPPLEPTE